MEWNTNSLGYILLLNLTVGNSPGKKSDDPIGDAL